MRIVIRSFRSDIYIKSYYFDNDIKIYSSIRFSKILDILSYYIANEYYAIIIKK